ncbi:recombinase family protein [Falsirhodobacter xinxiangensis]|uniref:recombinase family protein n=1 Tax=Falsirhodobacter xinxiangensis TaxID=2530049 RepID=UPI001FE8C638|nr:recombinase family protein [Rhodobacter xinxiangensis]
MTLRVALYARYSTDLQNAASIEDQIRLCRERALREGWQIVGTYEDAGLSGSSMILRPGLQRLLQDGRNHRFDLVLSEALDRISRNQADIATIYQNLSFAGVNLLTLADGQVNEMHIGLKGTMNALFLKELAAKTHRGLRGRVEKGKSGGGNAFGYSVLRHMGENGEIRRGDREINAEEAAIVQRISPPKPRECRRTGSPISSTAKAFRGPVPASGTIHHPWQSQARHGDPEQRDLYRSPGLEPAALRQGPGDRQAAGAPQSRSGVDHHRRARSAPH